MCSALILIIMSCGMPNETQARDEGPAVVKAEDNPELVLAGEEVTFSLWWEGESNSVVPIVCQTNAVEHGRCLEGEWAMGDPASSSPAVAVYVTRPRDFDAHEYFPFVCDMDGRCSEPLPLDENTCLNFDVIAEPGDDPGPYACDQSPAVGSEVDRRAGAAHPVPVSGLTGEPKTSGFKTEYFSSSEVMVDPGMYAPASTAPGTFATSGSVIDCRRRFHSAQGALVTFRTEGGITVTTKTDSSGTYAFIDVPVAKGGEWVVRTYEFPGCAVARYRDRYWRDVYAGALIELWRK